MKSFGEHSISLIACAAILLMASGAQAQSANGNSETTDASVTSSVPAEQTSGTPQATLKAPYWEPIGGLEFDTHGTGYMFAGPSYVRPLREKLALTARVFGNYLMYEFEDVGGQMRVRSPGLSTTVGLKFGDEHWFRIGAGMGVKRRNEKFTADAGPIVTNSDWDAGLNLDADVYANPTRRSNVHGMLHYGLEDRYLWSRLGVKRQVTNYSWSDQFTHYLGTEIMGQGNEDIRSLQLGGFVEFLHVKSSISVMLRGGWKRSTFDAGDNKTGPYLALGYYQRLN